MNPWSRRLTRLRAELIYMGRAARVLTGPLLRLALVWLVGAVVHHTWGTLPGHAAPSWREALFVSYCLLFLEHLDQVPPHPVAEVVHYLQPLLGIVLLSEGLIKLGITVFRKEENARVWVAIMARASREHVVVCGLGSVGFRVTEELCRLGVQVFAVERSVDGAFVERARELGAEVLIGDARADGALASLNIEHARAVIVATDDDLANMEIAMDVRELHAQVPIVMRLFDQRLAQKVKNTLGIEVSVSTSKLAAPLFASAALDKSVVGTHRVGDATLVVLQVGVGGGLAGASVGGLSTQHGVTVVSVRSPGQPWVVQPEPGRKLAQGEEVQLMLPAERIAEVHALNG